MSEVPGGVSDTSWWTWSKGDSRILEAVVGVAWLLVGLFDGLVPILGVTGLLSPTDTRQVHIEDLTQVPEAASADGVRLRGTHTAELSLPHPDLAERLLLVLPGLAQTALLLVILGLLFRMMRTLRDGDLFVTQNTRRLAVIAVAILSMAIVVPLVDTVTTHLLVRGTALASEVPTTFELSGSYLLLGFLTAAAAEAFRQGSRLRADTQGLV
ncbi:Protein of unknown function [Actinomadura meyerae]|uniref:DUF2975 domain-containing protein n=1 Tax=Actinomadura meyerae TaxID=240840 RepID=A0A239NNQ0_9ACTN|nr:Protein of unknown function [Actinomadura meyerae]